MTIVEEGKDSDGAELLISADSHVAISHDQVRAHLAPSLYSDYDAAVAAFASGWHAERQLPIRPGRR